MFFLLPLLPILFLLPYYLYQCYQTNSALSAKYALRNVPYVPSYSFFINLLFGQKPEQEIRQKIAKNGPIFGADLLGSPTITIAIPELLQLVLSKEFTSFTNRRSFKLNNPIFDSFLSGAQDEQWKRLRSIVTPTFSAGKLRRIKPKIDETISRLLENVSTSLNEHSHDEVLDIKYLFGCFTMDTICQVAFGIKVDSLADPENPIIANARKVFASDSSKLKLLGLTIAFKFPVIARLLGVGFTGFGGGVLEYFSEFSLEIITRKREELQSKGVQGRATSFLELILEAEAEFEEQQTREEKKTNSEEVKKSNKFMTNDEMISQCVLFFVAGYETTATILSMTAYYLALNPEVQEKLHLEIECVLKQLSGESPQLNSDPFRLVTQETLPKFEYLNAVLNETLRLASPAPYLERKASRDITLDSGSSKVFLKANDIVSIPVYSLHRDPKNFPEPETFRPERFLGTPTHHKYSYLPFGSGPRNCVARSLALLEANLALLHTVRQYRFSRVQQTVVPVEFFSSAGVLTPRDVHLKVERR